MTHPLMGNDLRSLTSLVVLLALLTPPVGGAVQRADLVLLGGTIVTLDADCPAAEALACRGDRIVAGRPGGCAAVLRPGTGDQGEPGT